MNKTQTSFTQQSGEESTKRKHHAIAWRLRNPVSDLVVLQLQDNLEYDVEDPQVTFDSLQIPHFIPIVLGKTLRIVTGLTETVNHQRKTNMEGDK
ncbi:MAG TPA: hypothetical protein VMH01_08850 [Puia sp.]|nr:hypothetical protein [Puia sp.]